jgi:hypothetical protein
MGAWGDKIMDSDESGDCAELLYAFAGLDPADDDFDATAPAVKEALTTRYDSLVKKIETKFKPDSRISRDRAYLVLLVMLIRAECPLPQALLQKIAAESSVFG